MRSVASLLRSAALVLPCAAALSPLQAQTFAAITGTDAVITAQPDTLSTHILHPGHHADTDAPLLYGRVRDGVYTVDGMVAKLRLNYDVNGARFLYLFVPGVGTAVLSPAPDPDSVSVEARLHDNELSFTAGDHHFKLTGVALSDGHNTVPDHLFVRLDRSAWNLNRRPMVGFGNAAALPYTWPGALPQTASSEESRVIPPVPVTLLPSSRALQPEASAAAPQSVNLH